MDAPKRQVSWLESFPPHIWAYIASLLSGEQLGRLMFTGSMLLRQRLKAPNVVRSIILGKDILAFKFFPKFLNDFLSLEELSIHCCGNVWSRTIRLKIDSIPSAVRKLELSGNWNDATNKLLGSSKTLEIGEILPRLQVLELNWLKLSTGTWLAKCPPSLTTLRVHHWDGTVELPSSLTDFRAAGVTLSRSSFVSKLPPSLESLVVIDEFKGLELAIPLLPPSTRKLVISGYPAVSVSPQTLLQQLPKSLTCLTVPNFTQGNLETNPGFISFLPSTITDLNLVPICPSSLWTLLPPGLTRLVLRVPASQCAVASKHIDNRGVEHDSQTIPFDLLPRSITNLELLPSSDLFFCGPPSTSNQSYFPPQLTSLRIPQIQLAPAAAKLLPSSLTFLQTTHLCEQVCLYLPTGLKTLVSFQTLMSPNLINFLPKSLSSLRLTFPHSRIPWFDYTTGERIATVSRLPEYSFHKKCVSHRFDWKDTSLLPSTLTHINLTNADDIGDSLLLHQQLVNLMELNLGTAKHFTDLSIPLLSPHLTTLDLSSSSMISGKTFPFLPPCLTFLDLSSSESIFDSDIQHLPRTLKCANWSHAIHLTDLCIPDLPPNLEKLSMVYNSKIPRSSFRRLPYSLRSCHIARSAEFLEWCIRFGEVQNKGLF